MSREPDGSRRCRRSRRARAARPARSGRHDHAGLGDRLRAGRPGARLAGAAGQRADQRSAPTVSWLPVLALAFVAVIVGAVAWSTYRLLHRRHGRLEPHHAVNRLVLAKACALAGALVAGGYFGYALSWLGLTDAALARRAGAALAAGRRRPAWPSSSGRCSWSARVGSARTTARPSLTTMAERFPLLRDRDVRGPPGPAAAAQRPGERRGAAARAGHRAGRWWRCRRSRRPGSASPPWWPSAAAGRPPGSSTPRCVQSRRDAAADRAGQAQAYRSMYAERASEHAEFTTVMTDRLTRRDREVADLTTAVDAGHPACRRRARPGQPSSTERVAELESPGRAGRRARGLGAVRTRAPPRRSTPSPTWWPGRSGSGPPPRPRAAARLRRASTPDAGGRAGRRVRENVAVTSTDNDPFDEPAAGRGGRRCPTAGRRRPPTRTTPPS